MVDFGVYAARNGTPDASPPGLCETDGFRRLLAGPAANRRFGLSGAPAAPRPFEVVLLDGEAAPAPGRGGGRIMLVIAVLRGTTVSIAGTERSVEPGEIMIVDPLRPYRLGHPEASRALGGPRRVAVPVALPPLGGVHGSVVPRADGAALAALLLALVRHGADMPPPVAAAARAGAGALIGALLGAQPVRGKVSKRDEILAFVAAEAACADLTAERIADRMAVSRTVLYRMFQPFGGVAACVLQQRLRLMRDALARRDDDRSVATIAYASGFRCASHANRKFREAYGLSPGAFRRAAAGPIVLRTAAAA